VFIIGAACVSCSFAIESLACLITSEFLVTVLLMATRAPLMCVTMSEFSCVLLFWCCMSASWFVMFSTYFTIMASLIRYTTTLMVLAGESRIFSVDFLVPVGVTRDRRMVVRCVNVIS